jgi:hypothetical protein
MRSFYPGTEDIIDFIEFGLDRDIPGWFPPIREKTVLHLGPGSQKEITDAVELDRPDWNADTDKIPFEDGEVGGIYATHFFEHLENPRFCLAECARVLATRAPLNILVPHATSLLYLQDLDHRSPFVLETWKTLLGNDYYDASRVGPLPLRIGFNAVFALKESNLVLVTQLIKE